MIDDGMAGSHRRPRKCDTVSGRGNLPDIVSVGAESFQDLPLMAFACGGKADKFGGIGIRLEASWEVVMKATHPRRKRGAKEFYEIRRRVLVVTPLPLHCFPPSLPSLVGIFKRITQDEMPTKSRPRHRAVG
jgi:hypothetical protein